MATGGYALTANLSNSNAATFDYLTTGALNASADQLYGSMTLPSGKLVQFSLTASTVATAPDSAVGMTIVDANGNTVFTMAAQAGQPLATGTVWLSASTYTVIFYATTEDGSALQTLTFTASGRELSDPMDPMFLNPTSPPTTSLPVSISSTQAASPSPPVSSSPPVSPPPPVAPPTSSSWFSISTLTTQPPPVPLVDPIANPFLGLN
jgi:hypothetical protein